MGIVVALLILYGTFKTIAPFFREPKSVPAENCESCIVTLTDTNTKRVIRYPAVVLIELPDSLYPKENITISASPQDVLVKVAEPIAEGVGNWAMSFKAQRKGTATITVSSIDATVADYTITFEVQ